MKIIEGEKCYKISEFAEIIGKTMQTIRNWDVDCELCADYRDGNGTRYYKERTVALYCKAHQIPFGDNEENRNTQMINQIDDNLVKMSDMIDSDNTDNKVLHELLFNTRTIISDLRNNI